MVLSLLFHLIADCVTLGVFTPKLIRSVALAPSYRRQHLHRWLFSWWPDLCRAVCNADVAWFATAGLLCFLQRSGKTRIARCVKGCGLHSMIRNCHQVMRQLSQCLRGLVISLISIMTPAPRVLVIVAIFYGYPYCIGMDHPKLQTSMKRCSSRGLAYAPPRASDRRRRLQNRIPPTL